MPRQGIRRREAHGDASTHGELAIRRSSTRIPPCQPQDVRTDIRQRRGEDPCPPASTRGDTAGWDLTDGNPCVAHPRKRFDGDAIRVGVPRVHQFDRVARIPLGYEARDSGGDGRWVDVRRRLDGRWPHHRERGVAQQRLLGRPRPSHRLSCRCFIPRSVSTVCLSGSRPSTKRRWPGHSRMRFSKSSRSASSSRGRTAGHRVDRHRYGRRPRLPASTPGPSASSRIRRSRRCCPIGRRASSRPRLTATSASHSFAFSEAVTQPTAEHVRDALSDPGARCERITPGRNYALDRRVRGSAAGYCSSSAVFSSSVRAAQRAAVSARTTPLTPGSSASPSRVTTTWASSRVARRGPLRYRARTGR